LKSLLISARRGSKGLEVTIQCSQCGKIIKIYVREGGVSVIDPCSVCIAREKEKSRSEGLIAGYNNGYKEGYEDGYDDCDMGG